MKKELIDIYANEETARQALDHMLSIRCKLRKEDRIRVFFGCDDRTNMLVSKDMTSTCGDKWDGDYISSFDRALLLFVSPERDSWLLSDFILRHYAYLIYDYQEGYHVFGPDEPSLCLSHMLPCLHLLDK